MNLDTAVRTAEAHWSCGDLAAAQQIYWSLLRKRVAQTADDGTALMAADLVIVERLADLATLLGQVSAADDLLDAMAALCTRAGNSFAADYTTLKRIHLALGCGDLRRADELLRSLAPTIGSLDAISFTAAGLDGWERSCRWPDTTIADRAVVFSRLYLALGWLLTALGQYGQGLFALRRGLLYIDDQAPSLAQQSAIPLHLAIIAAQLECGVLEEAGAGLKTLVPRLDVQRQVGWTVAWHELSARHALLQGQLGQAQEQLLRVCHICRERRFSQALLRAALSLAHMYIYLNQTDAARTLLADIGKQARASGDEATATRATALLQLAYARSYSPAGNIAIAPSVSRLWDKTPAEPKAKSPIAQPPDSPQSSSFLSFFEDRALGFYWALGYCGTASAVQRFAGLLQVFGGTDSAVILTRLAAMQGLLAYYEGDLKRAAESLELQRPRLRRLGLLPDLWQVQRLLGWCWLGLGRPQTQCDALAVETEALLAQITESLSGADRVFYLLNKWTADEEFLAAKTNRLGRIKQQVTTGPRLLRPFLRLYMMRELARLSHHIDRYKGAIAERELGGDERAPQRRRSMPWWQRLIAHPADRAIVAFVVLPDRVLMTRQYRFSLDFQVSGVTRVQLRELVRKWHEHASSAGQRRGLFVLDETDVVPPDQMMQHATRRNVADELTQILQLPMLLDGLPARVQALTIVPDDSLYGFPFAAMPYHDGYLIDRYSVTIAFEQETKKEADPPTRCSTALAIAVSQGAPPFQPLPGTRSEVEHVSSWLVQHGIDVRTITDAQADKATVVDGFTHAQFLHIACHGTFEPDQPDQSGLVLMPESGRYDLLSLRELAALHLDHLQHITLSSCWSADSFVLPGRWVISLPETLWRAGAGSILGCLWPVDDHHAVVFMTRFYHYLATFPRHEALRRTQLDCLHNNLLEEDTTPQANACHWAGFTLYGSPQHLLINGDGRRGGFSA